MRFVMRSKSPLCASESVPSERSDCTIWLNSRLIPEAASFFVAFRRKMKKLCSHAFAIARGFKRSQAKERLSRWESRSLRVGSGDYGLIVIVFFEMNPLRVTLIFTIVGLGGLVVFTINDFVRPPAANVTEEGHVA